MFAIEKKREGDTVTLRIRGILNGDHPVCCAYMDFHPLLFC